MEFFEIWFELYRKCFYFFQKPLCDLLSIDFIPDTWSFSESSTFYQVTFIIILFLSAFVVLPILIHFSIKLLQSLWHYLSSLKRRSKAQDKQLTIPSLAESEGTLVVTRMGDHIFSARTSNEVMAAHRDLIFRLKEQINFVGDSWEIVGYPMIERLASLCGSLPASEFNHDHGEYGLFRHSLEVAIEALEPNSRDNHYYKAYRRETSDKSYLRFKNPCSGLAIMFVAFSHDLSKLYTDYQVMADNGTLYDPRRMNMDEFIQYTQTKSLCVVFNKGRARRHDQGVAARSYLLLKDCPLAYFLSNGFTDLPSYEEYAARFKYELYEQEKDGEIKEDARGQSTADGLTDNDLLDGEISALKKKKGKDLSINEQARLAQLQDIKKKREEIEHFDTPNHWSNADVAALFDGSHPLWDIVTKADSFCSFCSNVTRNSSQYLPSYLVAFMIHLLKQEAHLVNNYFADIFIVSRGVFFRKGSAPFKELSLSVNAIKENDKQDWLSTLRSLNVVYMASNMRSYSWAQLECEDEVFYELGLIVKVDLPQRLIEAFPKINFIERGFNPPELEHIDWQRLQITRCDKKDQGQIVPTRLYADDIRTPIFAKRYHTTPALYVKGLGLDENESKGEDAEFDKDINADLEDAHHENKLEQASIQNTSTIALDKDGKALINDTCRKDDGLALSEAQTEVLHKISANDEIFDDAALEKLSSSVAKSKKSSAKGSDPLKDKKGTTKKAAKAKSKSTSKASSSKAQKSSSKTKLSRRKATQTLQNDAVDAVIADDKESVMAKDPNGSASNYEDLSQALYQTLQSMCALGQAGKKSSQSLPLADDHKLDAMLPMFMSYLATISPEMLSQSLKENFGIVADKEQLAQRAQLLLANALEHGSSDISSSAKTPVKEVNAQA